MSVNDEMVTITKTQYESLLDSQKMLRALEAGGVDNWEWYGESLSAAGYGDDEEYDDDDD